MSNAFSLYTWQQQQAAGYVILPLAATQILKSTNGQEHKMWNFWSNWAIEKVVIAHLELLCTLVKPSGLVTFLNLMQL